MNRNLWPWIVVLLLVVWVAAAGGLHADDPPPPAPEAAGEKGPPEENRDVNRTEGPSPSQDRPAAVPPARTDPSSRERRPYRPSEEIFVDKAVDFPADI